MEAFKPEDIAANISALPRKISRSLRTLTVPALLPSFLAKSESTEPVRVSSTAWLDGMRGVAAFLVYIRHFGAIHHPDIQVGYGGNENNHHLVQLPFVRLLVAGPAMVAMFFIISGYALSWAPLRALHVEGAPGTSRRENSMRRVSSGTFRRAFRLFAPGVVSTFLIMICISLGMYNWGHHAWTTEGDLPGFHEPQPPMWLKDPFSVQFWDWARASWNWTNLFKGAEHPYNPHLWTLGTEWRCSIALFVALLALSGTRVYLRLAGLIGLVAYSHYVNSWSHWLFFSGSALAQLKLIQDDSVMSSARKNEYILGDSKSEAVRHEEAPKYLSPGDHARIALFVLGLYLLSAPDYGFANWAPGYMWLSKLDPPGWPESWRVKHCYGGAMAVYAVSSTHTRLLRSLFDNRYTRYLGKISYALYLVHGPIVHMLGFWLVPFFWKFTGKETLVGRETGWLFTFAIQTALVVWAADLFWRGVDTKCVAIAKWFEELVKDNNL